MRRSVAARLGQLSDEQLSSPWPGRLLELAGIICIVMWPQLAGVRVWWMHWGFSPALFIAGLCAFRQGVLDVYSAHLFASHVRCRDRELERLLTQVHGEDECF
jgi:hypothetical protein